MRHRKAESKLSERQSATQAGSACRSPVQKRLPKRGSNSFHDIKPAHLGLNQLIGATGMLVATYSHASPPERRPGMVPRFFRLPLFSLALVVVAAALALSLPAHAETLTVQNPGTGVAALGGKWQDRKSVV